MWQAVLRDKPTEAGHIKRLALCGLIANVEESVYRELL
jgi:hypothetical protein